MPPTWLQPSASDWENFPDECDLSDGGLRAPVGEFEGAAISDEGSGSGRGFLGMAAEGEFDEVGDAVGVGVALVCGGSCFVHAAEVGLSPEIGGGRLTAGQGQRERALIRIVALDLQSGRLIAGR